MDSQVRKAMRAAHRATDVAKRAVYTLRGKKPRDRGYTAYKTRAIQQALRRPFDPEHLEPGWGHRLDERIVEYPWLFARLPAGPGKLLDAGSILNFDYLVEHPRIAEKRLFISNLQPEADDFYDHAVSYVFEDLRDSCFRDGFFDYAVCVSVIEHVGKDNTAFYAGALSKAENAPGAYLDVVRELHRVIRPGGRLLLTVPFGKYADHGWLQVFDAPMLDALIDAFAPTQVTEHHFLYREDGWHASDRHGSRDATYADFYKTGRYDPDFAVAARAVACLDLVR